MAAASGKSKSPRNFITYGSFEETSSSTTTPGSGGREGELSLNRSSLSLTTPADHNLSSLTYASLADQMYLDESRKVVSRAKGKECVLCVARVIGDMIRYVNNYWY